MISMGSQDSNFGTGSLLDDLIEFVYNRRNNAFGVNRGYQLPPGLAWMSVRPWRLISCR